MSDQFVGEIRMFGFNFAPTGWAQCNGQLIPISQNTALFALLGTFYGGDGKSTFALPDMRGNAPMHQGQGSGLSQRSIGEMSGVETITLLVSEIPVHIHNWQGLPEQADAPSPQGASVARPQGAFTLKAAASQPLVQMAPQALAPAGGGLPHNNMQPYLVLNFCIAMQGIFPQRP
jgi:microcystin-dependent protein